MRSCTENLKGLFQATGILDSYRYIASTCQQWHEWVCSCSVHSFQRFAILLFALFRHTPAKTFTSYCLCSSVHDWPCLVLYVLQKQCQLKYSLVIEPRMQTLYLEKIKENLCGFLSVSSHAILPSNWWWPFPRTLLPNHYSKSSYNLARQFIQHHLKQQSNIMKPELGPVLRRDYKHLLPPCKETRKHL